jgi:ribonuclease P protein component
LKRADFLRVQAGRSLTRRSFVLKARPRPGAHERQEDDARFGFTVTKRLGSAVVRNRARRRLKEAVRLVAPEYAQPGFDYVLIGRPEALSQAFGEILEELQTALEQILRQREQRVASKAVR